MEVFDYAIVGAGPSGLTAAYQLLKAGCSVVLIERDKRTGGLSKSYNYQGQIFDTGPKRFHTQDPIVLDFIQEIMQGGMMEIGFSAKVYYLDKYFQLPLAAGDILRIPPHIALSCIFDFLKKHTQTDKASFHQYIQSRFGETFYKTFFKPYTEKFMRWDADDIHRDWIYTVNNQNIVDNRVPIKNFKDVLKSLVKPNKTDIKFLYPKQGGFGGFYDQLSNCCQHYPKFRLILSDTITQLSVKGRLLEATTKHNVRLACKDMIWTGNLNSLSSLMDYQETRLNYLNTIFYNIVYKEQGIGRQRAQWIYVGKKDSLISRITCTKEFALYASAQGYYNMICELTDSQINPVYFGNASGYKDGVIEELLGMKFITHRRFIEDIHIEKIKDTYPIYHKRYKEDFGAVAGKVRQFSKNIHLLGRSGAFWYNNSDHSIRFALEMTDRLLKGQTKPFDYRQYFGAHHQKEGHVPSF